MQHTNLRAPDTTIKVHLNFRDVNVIIIIRHLINSSTSDNRILIFIFLLKAKSPAPSCPRGTYLPIYIYTIYTAPIQALMRGDKITKRRPRPTISNVTCLRAFPGLRVTASHYSSSPLVIISK